MNPILWILAGVLMGALTYVLLNLNLARGLILSVSIGAVAAYLGGDVLAPLLAARVESGTFNPFALLVATASALAGLVITDMMAKRLGV